MKKAFHVKWEFETEKKGEFGEWEKVEGTPNKGVSRRMLFLRGNGMFGL